MEDGVVNRVFQLAIERNRGALTWDDIVYALENVRKARINEQLMSILSDMSVADLTTSLRVARTAKEAASAPPAVAAPQPPSPPVALTNARNKKR